MARVALVALMLASGLLSAVPAQAQPLPDGVPDAGTCIALQEPPSLPYVDVETCRQIVMDLIVYLVGGPGAYAVCVLESGDIIHCRYQA